jgi:hypothetical protein
MYREMLAIATNNVITVTIFTQVARKYNVDSLLQQKDTAEDVAAKGAVGGIVGQEDIEALRAMMEEEEENFKDMVSTLPVGRATFEERWVDLSEKLNAANALERIEDHKKAFRTLLSDVASAKRR